MSDSKKQLNWAMRHLAQLQHAKLDNLRLRSAIDTQDTSIPPPAQVQMICSKMVFDKPKPMPVPDVAYLPLLFYSDEIGWAVVSGRNADGTWKLVTKGKSQNLSDAAVAQRCLLVNMQASMISFGAGALLGSLDRTKGFIRHVYETLRLYRGELLEGIFATVFIGFLALATSLFSMQVYDRVIPTRNASTLFILTSGVLLTILMELSMKYARSYIMDYVVVGMDNRLSREVFSRLMSVRVDQLPPSVGSLAGQIRGYEQVRSFYTASTLFTLVDLPLGLVFLLIILIIASPLVAVVPLIAGLCAILLGLRMRTKILNQAVDTAAMSNFKTGLLVEAVEGIETIKSGSGGWKFLARWININNKTIKNDLKTRHITEGVAYWSAAIQQISYALLVVAGAVTVMDGTMTMGTLIACSIMSGRVLAPVIALPNLLVQHAHAKAALEGLEKLYQLKTENHEIERPLTPSKLEGRYTLVNVKFGYGDSPPALVIPKLEIAPGERIAILGPIGAGKSTLIKLLSGMYHPLEGRVMLDGLDIGQIHRQVVSEHVGYLQQDHRLFVGTLRENLLIGLPDPGDDLIMDAMRRTGMDKMVSVHPKGLDRPIAEGGKGLSGGQKQLVAFTRLILTDPDVLLLDEPTASMDDEQERRCLAVLAEEAQRNKTMVIVTHKPSILPLVTRVMVVTGTSIVLDGPRDQVLQKLQQSGEARRQGQAAAPAQATDGPQQAEARTASARVPAKPTVQLTPPSQNPATQQRTTTQVASAAGPIGIQRPQAAAIQVDQTVAKTVQAGPAPNNPRASGQGQDPSDILEASDIPRQSGHPPVQNYAPPGFLPPGSRFS